MYDEREKLILLLQEISLYLDQVNASLEGLTKLDFSGDARLPAHMEERIKQICGS